MAAKRGCFGVRRQVTLSSLFLNLLHQSIKNLKMGCEQSDVMPFINSLNDDSEHSQQRRGQQPQPQQPTYSQPQYSQPPAYQQPSQQQYYQQQALPQQPYQQYPPQPQSQPQPPTHYQSPPQVYPQSQTYQQPQTYQPPQTHQQPPQPVNYAPPQNQMAPAEKQVQLKVGGGKVVKKVMEQRQYLQLHANFNEDFLSHHLKYELTLTKLTSMKRIRRRQIMEHLYLQELLGIGGVKDLEISFQAYQESLISAWTQRTFLDIWEQAHDDFFVKHLEEKEVRRKVSEQFMFQLFQLKEYVDSGISLFVASKSQIELLMFVQSSDDALFNIFKKLKERYPQTQANDNIEFPDVPSTKTNMDLLNNFNKLSFSDPANMNYQTIYEDINFLLKRAVEEKDTFKVDMQDILGSDVLACPKVGEVTKDGKKSFNACAVRRVFVKWAQNLLQKCPDLIATKSFMRFIKAKADIVNNFVFKSTIKDSTHKIVIDCISLLLEIAKYDLKDRKRRQEFIFNIYDLLRCKIKRNSATEIVDLLKKMQATSVTKSGKKFEVIRVKNRFKTNNRDLLINFRYGDVLVGQAQLCVDNANLSKQAKLNYEFCHYIYELERSLFGPTLQLMMQYEDFQRPDITVSFEAEDVVLPRGNQAIKDVANTQRKCLQGHDMITMSGNYFMPASDPDQTEEETINRHCVAICNYCDRETTLAVPYDYCYHCGCFLCSQCREEYKKYDIKQFWLSVQRQELLPPVKTLAELQNLCYQNKSIIVLFWLQDSSPSILFKDAMIYQQCKLMNQPRKYVPKIYQAQFTNSPSFRDFCNRYNITEYPTLLLLDQKAQAIRTVIGCSWYQAPVLYASQKRLIEGLTLDLDIYCTSCQGKMQAGPITEGSVCTNCVGASRAINMPPQFSQIQAFCENGHYRCINCVYSAINTSTTYKDGLGALYLSSKVLNPNLPKCPQGHQTTITRDYPAQSWVFNCFRCHKSRFFDNQHGTAECKQCKAYLCSACMGAYFPTFAELKHLPSIVKHFVESTAEEVCLCLCNRNFKKVYISRVLFGEQQTKDIKQSSTWLCSFCKKTKQDGQLHLACFGCPYLSKIKGQTFNFQLCISCAAITKLLLRESQEKVAQQPTLFICPNDHNPLVFTSIDYNKQLVINCAFCKKNYFANSQRLHCKSCNLNCCKNCRQELINRSRAPMSQHRCASGHNLSFRFISPKELKSCEGCYVFIRDEGFTCDKDEYVLCTECVLTKPPNFVGSWQLWQTKADEVELQFKNLQPFDYNQDFIGNENSEKEQNEYGVSNLIDDIFD